MLEKHGSLIVTEQEKVQILGGEIPERINNLWGLSLEELIGIINTGQYRITGKVESVISTQYPFPN